MRPLCAPRACPWLLLRSLACPQPGSPQAKANATAQNVTGTEEKYTFSDLDKTTLTNIPSRDSSLWAHAVVTWAVTLVAYVWLWKCVGPGRWLWERAVGRGVLRRAVGGLCLRRYHILLTLAALESGGDRRGRHVCPIRHQALVPTGAWAA